MGDILIKPRFYVIIGVIALCVIIAIAYSASTAPSNKKIKESETVTITINSNIGIDRVTITNLNTGQSIVKTIIDLPFSFNVTRGDYLRIAETTQTGFQWNAWEFSPMGRFDQHNPLTFEANGDICINNQISMTPKCIILEISPTATPTPSPSPSPEPTSTAFT